MGASIINISRGTTRINADFAVQEDIEGAFTWFSRDLSLAFTTDVVDLAASVNHMRVDWTDQTGWATPGSENFFTEYTLSGTDLVRNYNGATSTVVARRVADIQFSRSGKYITIAITSSKGGRTDTFTYSVTPRASQLYPGFVPKRHWANDRVGTGVQCAHASSEPGRADVGSRYEPGLGRAGPYGYIPAPGGTGWSPGAHPGRGRVKCALLRVGWTSRVI